MTVTSVFLISLVLNNRELYKSLSVESMLITVKALLYLFTSTSNFLVALLRLRRLKRMIAAFGSNIFLDSCV